MMKMRKFIASLASLLMLVSIIVPQQPVFAAESGIEVQFNNGGTQANSNTINAKFKVVNNGSSSVSLSQLKLRYYYTKDANTSQNFYCDYAGMMSGGAHSNMTNKITGTIVDMSNSVATADTYIEVGFTSDAGTLAAGGSIEIQTRVARSDWSNYNQSNDFSYKMAGSYEVWDQVAAYLNGTLVFGQSPTDEPSTKDPEISPKSATFNKSAPRNITVSLTPNGNTFKGISGLTMNTHYTVSGNTVTILSSYLSTLSVGSRRLTFDFGVTNNPVLNLSITEDVSTDNLEVSIGEVTGNTGETVTVPVNFKNVSKVGNVITCNFYINYNSSLLEPVSVSAGDIVKNSSVNFASQINKSTSSISFLFLDDTLGDQLITQDGVFAYIDFKVLGSAGQTARLQFTDEGAFGDGNMSRINAVNKVDGSVVIGAEEGPTISPSTEVFDKYRPSNIRITLSPNGSSFVGITGLSKGTDYTVSGNTVTILGSYLSTLSLGSKRLTFDFGVANNPQLTLTIKDSTPSGDELGVIVGTVTGNTNDTVTVPVDFTNVSKVGNVITCNFYLTYDPSLLEPVSVSAGNIVKNPSVNFASKINASTNSISFLFLDDTLGDQLITQDGVFANIDFKVLGSAGQTAKIQFSEDGAFGDGNMSRINAVNKVDGAVIIASVEDPTIYPEAMNFDKFTPSDITVTLTPNGSTFRGISGLRANIDYTVSNNTVIISKSYLASLPLGLKELTFDFGVSNNPILSVTIEDSTPISEDSLSIAIGTVYGQTGDTVLVPISVADVEKVGNIGAYGFTVTYDSTLLKPVALVEADIVIDNGIASMDVLSDSAITEKNSMNFMSTDFGLMEVAPEYARSIYLSFNAFESQNITEDGVLVYIEFEILGGAGTEAALNINRYGVFENGNREIITNIKYTDGKVVIMENEEELDPSITPISASFDKYNPSDITVLMIPYENTFNGITGLVEGRDYNVLGNTVVISKSYLSSLDLGSASFTFDFGVSSNPVLNVMIEDSTPVETGFNISIGKVSGKTGDTITVPVKLDNISMVDSVITFNFYITYDDTLLEAVSVEAGDIIINAPINFASKINQGSISVLFLDNTLGDELITEDGVVVNITFKILGTESEETPLVFQEEGAFGDGNMDRINDIKKINGSVKIN